MLKNAGSTGAVLAMVAVLLSAFGAHWLKERISAADLETFRLAANYQLIHAIAILLAFTCSGSQAHRVRAIVFFLAGMALFSGSLYALATTGIRQFGMITPLGGLAFMIGWIFLALGLRSGQSAEAMPS